MNEEIECSWDRMEEKDRETEEDTERRNELHRVIEKIRKMPQKQEKQLETSGDIQEQEDSPEAETESTSSIGSMGVPAINFKIYMGATAVRYIQMGQASHVQEENKWDLEETIRQAEQKLATDRRTFAKETTNDERLLTRRERTKSTPYLRLKKRKTIFWKKT